MNVGFKNALRLAGALLVVAATPARAYDYFFEDFSGPLDPAKWETSQLVSGMRWCSDTIYAHTTNPGVWVDVSTTPCHGAVQGAPYGAVSFATDADGTTSARFASPLPNVTFPYLFAGPGFPRSPFPATGDFALEVRIRYEGLNGHGDGVLASPWADPIPFGNNPPGLAGVFGIWGDASIYHPIGQWQTYRLEYTGGVATSFVDGVQQGPPAATVRPVTLWIGHPVVTFWGVTSWSPFAIDYVRVSIPVTPVQIDIKPGAFPNPINLGSNGVVPVAILGSSTFDATKVDPSTVTLAGAPVRLTGKGTPQSSLADVNMDGFMDLVVHVNTAALHLTPADVEAVLEGKTVDGERIRGADTIKIVP